KKIKDYDYHNIELLFNNKVVAIDPKAKHVTTDKGLQIDYDKLVLAHGGDLFIPPIEGIGNQGVFSCKQFLETEKLNSHQGNCAVVIGSGAIGIEAAEALKKKGYQVYIIELLDWILPTLFDEPTAKRLEAAMENYGINICTGEKVLRIKGNGRVKGVITDQRELECDTVVVATGVVPGTKLAQTAGIETNRGILVNKFMQTSVPDIYACGDCVETIDANTGESAIFQLKHNALEQGKIAAKNISGEQAIYHGAHAFARAHFFKTHAATFGKTLQGSKSLSGESEIFEKDNGTDYLRVILMDGKIIGGQAIGKYAESIGLLIGAMRRKEDINQLRRKWKHIVQSDIAYLLPQLRLGHIFEL
ncbi:MAG: NAD(P)/FAD-dependent oxidoreductase, partial [Desulfobacteraceae bacterium]|nr:NAD(P)/FAD-dependent oxidoreductase [Desulfobacteraceae bacterium]